MKPAIDRFDGPQVRFTDGTSCAPDAIICATGYRPGLEQMVGHLVKLDEHGMPPFTGASSSPLHPGLWFFGLDRSIYGNMHVHRRQARHLAQAIARQSRAPEGSVPRRH
jgi:hypothetical protein